jgi:DNA-binding GntR family transcriptional regulator
MKTSRARARLSSLRRADLAEQAAKTIRQAILEQHLKPGDRITELELASELNISCTPIREALRYLEREGLIQRKPFQGIYIASMQPRELREVFRIRAVLEAMAIEDARSRIQPTDMKILRGYVHAMKRAAAKRDLSTFNLNDMSLHRHVRKVSGNGVLEKLLNDLSHQSFVAYNIQTLAVPTDKELKDLVDTHWDFLALLEDPSPNLDLVKRLGAIQNKWVSQMEERLFKQKQR